MKKTKAAKTSKKVIKYLGTGRGEDVIFAQENSIKAIETANSIDEITIDTKPVLSDINAGISDFSSAVYLDENAEKIAVETLSDDSINTQKETKSSKTQKKPESNTRKKSAAKKSNSKRTDKSNSTLSKRSTNSTQEKQRITDEIDEKNSSTEAKDQLPKQQRKSRASIGLPDWKPRTRT